jgi:hypothetical protein
MEEDGHMSDKVATCLYMSKEVVEAARKVGLNLSKVAENALIEAIRRLHCPEPETARSRAFVGEGRDRDLNPGARLHRPIGYQATSPRPHFALSYF